MECEVGMDLPGVVVHVFKPSTKGAEAGRSLQVLGKLGLQSENLPHRIKFF